MSADKALHRGWLPALNDALHVRAWQQALAAVTAHVLQQRKTTLPVAASQLEGQGQGQGQGQRQVRRNRGSQHVAEAQEMQDQCLTSGGQKSAALHCKAGDQGVMTAWVLGGLGWHALVLASGLCSGARRAVDAAAIRVESLHADRLSCALARAVLSANAAALSAAPAAHFSQGDEAVVSGGCAASGIGELPVAVQALMARNVMAAGALWGQREGGSGSSAGGSSDSGSDSGSSTGEESVEGEGDAEIEPLARLLIDGACKLAEQVRGLVGKRSCATCAKVALQICAGCSAVCIWIGLQLLRVGSAAWGVAWHSVQEALHLVRVALHLCR